MASEPSPVPMYLINLYGFLNPLHAALVGHLDPTVDVHLEPAVTASDLQVSTVTVGGGIIGYSLRVATKKLTIHGQILPYPSFDRQLGRFHMSCQTIRLRSSPND